MIMMMAMTVPMPMYKMPPSVAFLLFPLPPAET